MRHGIVVAAVTVVLAIIAGYFGALALRQDPAHHGRIYKIGFDAAPPLSEIGTDGKPGGLAVSLLQEAARRKHIQLQWVPLPGTSPEQALREGIVDIWPALGTSARRRQQFHLTTPWLTASFALVSKRNASIFDPADVAGKEVAFTGYLTATEIASFHLPRSILKKSEPRSEVLRSVCTGKMAAGFEEASYLNMQLLQSPPDCAGIPLRVQIIPGAASPVSIAARRDAAAAADALRSAFDAMAVDGSMTEALDRWASFSANETRSIFELEEAQDRRLRLQFGLAVVLVALAALLWQVFRARRATREARRASEAKSEFLANMSHEIRTPMNGVLGMLDLVLDAPITEKQRAELVIARDSSASLLAILTDILDFSKIEAGQMKLVEAPFSPLSCVSSVVRLFETFAGEKGLSLTLAASNIPNQILGDELRFRQVVTNLVSNALKFTDRGGVTLQMSAELLSPLNGTLQLTVEDTGIGIPVEHQPQLFSKFTQIDSSMRRRHGGSGLGLSIAKSAVELMRGSLAFSSAAGTGSSFRVNVPFTIPSHAEQVVIAEPSMESNPTPGLGTRVLVAEDNPVNQLVISRSLQSLGYAVDIAENGEKAVALCSGTPYAAILMDCQMPVMDGYEATARIRKSGNANQAVPIIAVTAHATQRDEALCRAAGMTDYLTKPISKERLLRVMSRLTTIR